MSSNIVLVVVVILLLAASLQALRLILRGRSSLRWPTAKGKVIALEVVGIQRRNVGRASFRPTIRYSYRVNGRDYEGDRIGLAFVPLTMHSHEAFTLQEASQVLDGYYPGALVEVYYDPEDPAYSLLRPGAPSRLRLAGFAVVAALVTFGGMWAFLVPR